MNKEKIRNSGLYVIAYVNKNIVYSIYKNKIYTGDQVIKTWDKEFESNPSNYEIYEIGLMPLI